MAGIGAALGVTGMVEIDVRRTVDGVLVLSHDDTVAGYHLAETTWKQLGTALVEGRHRVPTLTEVLAAFPDRSFDLELKNFPATPGFSAELPIEVAEMARPGDVITSFYWPDVDTIRNERPDVATGILFEAAISMSEAFDHAEARGHAVVAPRFDCIEAGAVGEAHARGIAVVAWTVNEPEVARRLADWGVDVIVTDDPGSMVAVLEGIR